MIRFKVFIVHKGISFSQMSQLLASKEKDDLLLKKTLTLSQYTFWNQIASQSRENDLTFLGGMVFSQGLWGVVTVNVDVAVMGTVGGRVGGIVEWHRLACFSTLHVKLQYDVKHQPAPSVSL